jgi:3-methyladenine DNA glycosylase AlkD
MDKISSLKRKIISYKDNKKKKWWENYVKHDTYFLGVGIPIVRAEIKKWYIQENIGKLSFDEQLKISLSLFDNKYSEEKIAGILFLELFLVNNISWEELLSRCEGIFAKELIYDWNICDWFCVKVLAKMIEKKGIKCAKVISQWQKAKNLWQARCSLVAFVNVKNKSDYKDLIWQASETLLRREERFAKTAVGWIMREFSKIDSKNVFNFLVNNKRFINKEVITNALKYDKDLQKKLL